MLKTLRFTSTAVCLLAFLAVGCAKVEDENDLADQPAAEPAGMPAPAPGAPEVGPAAPTTTQLEEKEGSGITGEVTATHDPNNVTIQISLNGLKAGQIYPAHVHTGTCEAGGPVDIELSTVTATGTSGQSTSTVAPSRLGDKPSFVQVHDATGKAVACSNLPGHTTP